MEHIRTPKVFSYDSCGVSVDGYDLKTAMAQTAYDLYDSQLVGQLCNHDDLYNQ